MKEYNPNDQAWREIFEDATSQPDPLLWDNISKVLDQQQDQRPLWNIQKIAVAAVLIILISSVSIYTYQSLKTQPDLALSTNRIGKSHINPTKDNYTQTKTQSTSQHTNNQQSQSKPSDVANNTAPFQQKGAQNTYVTKELQTADTNPVSIINEDLISKKGNKLHTNQINSEKSKTSAKHLRDHEEIASNTTQKSPAQKIKVYELNQEDINLNPDAEESVQPAKIQDPKSLASINTDQSGSSISNSQDSSLSHLPIQPQEALALQDLALHIDQEPKPIKYYTTTIGAYISPIYSNQNYYFSKRNQSTILTSQGMTQDQTKEEIEEEFRQNTRALPSYQAGFSISTPLKGRWTIETGLEYSELYNEITTNYTSLVENQKQPTFITLLNEDVKDRKKQTSTATLPKPQHEVTKEQVSYTYTNSFAYLGMPIRIGYGLQHRKVKLTLLAGITPRILLANHITEDDITHDKILNKNHIYRNLHIQGQIALKASYIVDNHWSINFEPHFQKAFYSITKPMATIQSKPTSYGASLGISYRLVSMN